MPTVVIHGDKDFVPLWTAKAIAAAIPNAKLIVIKDSGHFPFVEKSDAFFQAVA